MKIMESNMSAREEMAETRRMEALMKLMNTEDSETAPMVTRSMILAAMISTSISSR